MHPGGLEMRGVGLLTLLLLAGCAGVPAGNQSPGQGAGAPGAETQQVTGGGQGNGQGDGQGNAGQQQPAAGGNGDAGSRAATSNVLNVTPHILVERQSSGATIGFWDDTYTRVRVTAVALGSGGGTGSAASVVNRDYDEERRNAIARFFVGKTLSANLTFRVDIAGERPAYSAVIPVVAMSHTSNSEVGEAWSTDIYGQSVNKLVRIRAGSRVSIAVELARSRSADSQIVQSALNVAREATKVISPESDLLTTFTKNSVDKEAQIWDSALGKLFSLSLSEKVLSDSLLQEFSPDMPIVSVKLRLPKDLDSNGLRDALDVGEWHVSLDCPTRSLFIAAKRVTTGNNKVSCQEQVESLPTDFKLAPERVLNYPLSENSTIYSYLLASTEFSTRLQDVAAASGSELPTQAKKLCSVVLDAGEALGLTRIDSNLLLWAVAQRLPIASKATDVQAACADSRQTIRELITPSS